MIWQDVVISIANVIFILSTFGQVVHGFQKKKGYVLKRTSLSTSIGLFAMSLCFFTLSLYFSAVLAFISAVLWFILFIQRMLYKKA